MVSLHLSSGSTLSFLGGKLSPWQLVREHSSAPGQKVGVPWIWKAGWTAWCSIFAYMPSGVRQFQSLIDLKFKNWQTILIGFFSVLTYSKGTPKASQSFTPSTRFNSHIGTEKFWICTIGRRLFCHKGYRVSHRWTSFGATIIRSPVSKQNQLTSTRGRFFGNYRAYGDFRFPFILNLSSRYQVGLHPSIASKKHGWSQ